jgi:hypothetical protein
MTVSSSPSPSGSSSAHQSHTASSSPSVSSSGSFSCSTSGSVSATATATSTATDLRPVWAAAAVAAQLSAQDEHQGVISSSTILGTVLGAVGLWAVGAGVYSKLYKQKQMKQRAQTALQKSQTVPTSPIVVTPNPVLLQQIPMRKANPILAAAQETRATFGPTSAVKRTLRLQDSTKFKVERSVVQSIQTAVSEQSPQKPTQFQTQQLKPYQAYRARKIQRE